MSATFFDRAFPHAKVRWSSPTEQWIDLLGDTRPPIPVSTWDVNLSTCLALAAVSSSLSQGVERILNGYIDRVEGT